MCSVLCHLAIGTGWEGRLAGEGELSDTQKAGIWELGMQGLFIGNLALFIRNSLTHNQKEQSMASSKIYQIFPTLPYLGYKEVQGYVG